MKRISLFFRLLFLMVLVTACSANDNISTVIEEGENVQPDLDNKKVLVAYFSRAGRSFDTIRNLCLKSTVLNGIAVHTQDATGSERQIREWLQTIGILK